MNIDQIINKQLEKTNVLEGVFTISEGKRKGKLICNSMRNPDKININSKVSLLNAQKYYLSLPIKCGGDKDCINTVKSCTEHTLSLIKEYLYHYK